MPQADANSARAGMRSHDSDMEGEVEVDADTSLIDVPPSPTLPSPTKKRRTNPRNRPVVSSPSKSPRGNGKVASSTRAARIQPVVPEWQRRDLQLFEQVEALTDSIVRSPSTPKERSRPMGGPIKKAENGLAVFNFNVKGPDKADYPLLVAATVAEHIKLNNAILCRRFSWIGSLVPPEDTKKPEWAEMYEDNQVSFSRLKHYVKGKRRLAFYFSTLTHVENGSLLFQDEGSAPLSEVMYNMLDMDKSGDVIRAIKEAEHSVLVLSCGGDYMSPSCKKAREDFVEYCRITPFKHILGFTQRSNNFMMDQWNHIWVCDRLTTLLMDPVNFWEELQQDLLDCEPSQHPVLKDTPVYHVIKDDELLLTRPNRKRSRYRVPEVHRERQQWGLGCCVDIYSACGVPSPINI